MSKRRRLFTMILTVVLCFAMAVPVSAGTSYNQRKKASQKLFNAVYYGKYSKTYNFGSDCYTYDTDINKDGWPEHIVKDLNSDTTVVYTIYKNKIRRYVFKNASSPLRYKKQLVISRYRLVENNYQCMYYITDTYYNIVKGKLVANKSQTLIEVDDWENDTKSYVKGGKEITMGTYHKLVNKQKFLKSSNYWSKLFNATKNFS